MEGKMLGFIIILLSTACYAALIPLLKKANQEIQPFTVIAISTFIVFVCSFLISMLFENGISLGFLQKEGAIGLLVLVGVINTIGFWLAIKAYPFFDVWQQSMFGLLTPIFAGILAYFILKEQIKPNLFAGLAIVSIGLYIAVK